MPQNSHETCNCALANARSALSQIITFLSRKCYWSYIGGWLVLGSSQLEPRDVGMRTLCCLGMVLEVRVISDNGG
jgi:hypothetical protein